MHSHKTKYAHFIFEFRENSLTLPRSLKVILIKLIIDKFL